MPHRHTIYCSCSVAQVTPEDLSKHLETLDYKTLGEDYDLSEATVEVALPLRITNDSPGLFHRYHLSYGEQNKRPIEIERWETERQHHDAVDETIENVAVEDTARLITITNFLDKSVDSVSVAFGIDPPAAMFAWEVVRYFASEFDGIIDADDGEWLKIGDDYQPKLV